MKDKWTYIITASVIAILVIILLVFRLFNATIFGIVLFFSVLYLARYFYLRYQFDLDMKKQREFFGRRQKFDWCWDRVNRILLGMPGGQGLAWESGRDVESMFQTFHNGISMKPFRSFYAYLAESNTTVLMIYDIDEDDIVVIHQNPDATLIRNHFSGFNPFQSSGGFGFGGMNDFNQDPNRGQREGVNINLGGYEPKYNKPTLEPDENAVNNAVNKLR